MKEPEIFALIRLSEGGDFKILCQLMKPSEKFSRIQSSDIRRYSDLVHTISADPILKRLPHYLDSNNKFPTPQRRFTYQNQQIKNIVPLRLSLK